MHGLKCTQMRESVEKLDVLDWNKYNIKNSINKFGELFIILHCTSNDAFSISLKIR